MKTSHPGPKRQVELPRSKRPPRKEQKGSIDWKNPDWEEDPLVEPIPEKEAEAVKKYKG